MGNSPAADSPKPPLTRQDARHWAARQSQPRSRCDDNTRQPLDPPLAKDLREICSLHVDEHYGQPRDVPLYEIGRLGPYLLGFRCIVARASRNSGPDHLSTPSTTPAPGRRLNGPTPQAHGAEKGLKVAEWLHHLPVRCKNRQWHPVTRTPRSHRRQ